MEIRPSYYTSLVDRRILFCEELQFGGQGATYLSGGNNTISSVSGYVFYKIDFISTSIINNLGVYGNYNLNTGSFSGRTIPAPYSLYCPLTSINFSGQAVAYSYVLPTMIGGNCTYYPLGNQPDYF